MHADGSEKPTLPLLNLIFLVHLCPLPISGAQADIAGGRRCAISDIALVEDAGQIRAPSRFEVAAQQDGVAIADPGSSRHHQRS
jgi:hypothetical protein